MAKFTIETLPSGMRSMETKRISGFKEGELNELKSMPHEEAREKIVDMLNYRNNGIGSVWMCGYGIFGLWFDNEFAYLNVGKSCD